MSSSSTSRLPLLWRRSHEQQKPNQSSVNACGVAHLNRWCYTLMRQGGKTPSYDSENPHWDQQHSFSDGTFVEFGGQGVNRWDYRITNVIVSEFPRSLVSISGRCASRPRRSPEFLSIRIGAMPPKYIALSLESTTFLHIDAKGILTVSHRKISVERFRKLWGDAMKGSLNSSAFKVSAGVLSIAEDTGPGDAANRSQSIHSATNRKSSAVGSRR